ncbi:MAG: hypothetical protein E7533_00285 [Ruminococcaceae bacterium]|nr:hypothetical protein [Oscillospiraceae bacterium]
MKKIIASCSVLLALSLVFALFAGCGGKGDDGNTTTTKNNTVTINGLTAEIEKTSATIKKDGEVFQKLEYPVNPDFKFDLEYAKSHYEFKDMNFDGVPDFYIAASKEGDVISFMCWLFNDTNKTFEYSIILSSLKNISVDTENQRIYSTINFEGVEKVVAYKWVDGSLDFDKQYDNSSDTIPEDVAGNVQSNSIGVNAETSADDETTTKAPKPSKGDKDDTTKKPVTTDKETEKETEKPTQNIKPDTGNGENVQLGSGDIDDGWSE